MVEVKNAAEGRVRVSVSDIALPLAVDASPQVLHKHTTVGTSAREAPRSSCHSAEKRVKGNVRIG
jgi:hypothetical protein